MSPLPPGVDWIPVDEALARLRTRTQPLDLPAELVPLHAAAGRILAAPVAALRDNPPSANAAVDGWGYAAATARPVMPVAGGRAAPGQPYAGRVPEGQAVRILTGAPLPEGVDTVAMQEDATCDGGQVTLRLPRAHANARPAGEDAQAGATLLAAGHRLRPADLALLAATGTAAVPARQRLRVGVLSTGDEIAEPGARAPAHRTYDANRPMLLALLEDWGLEAVDLGIQPDDPGAIRAALDRGAAECHAIISSGGASAGDEDHIARLLRTEGDLTAWRIAMKPGRPLALARWGGAPVFGLPGNPVAAFVCALIFARPALAALAGAGWPEAPRFRVPAAFSRRWPEGRREWLRARLTPDGAAELFVSEGSGRVSGLSWAQGLVDLGHAGGSIDPGDLVDFLPFSGFRLT